MSVPVIVEAVRSPIGRRRGGLSQLHPADLLARVVSAAVDRSGIPPEDVGQVIGGCVTQVGEQCFNIARTAWLIAGLPQSVAATTVDAQCGSSQQAVQLAAALIASDTVDVAVACGVEMMSRIPLGAGIGGDTGRPLPPSYEDRYERTSQFEGAERIAAKWGVTRADADAFGLRSQRLASKAWQQGHFDREVVAVAEVSRDEGLRDTNADALAALKPVMDGGVHTAGTSSQISDGAAAVVLCSAEKAAAVGVQPRATVRAQALVGVDPVLMLTGPMDATPVALQRAGVTASDIDVFECNEAFASVVLAWERECGIDPERVNVNGGAIAIGHPTGATGARLVTTTLHELERRDGNLGLVTMCCGGGLGTATVLERG
ncbi:MAG: steroid 3-ketoacyl-CoA thiolase [Actinomycetes bacterium]